jgi:hypothetical protein
MPTGWAKPMMVNYHLETEAITTYTSIVCTCIISSKYITDLKLPLSDSALLKRQLWSHRLSVSAQMIYYSQDGDNTPALFSYLILVNLMMLLTANIIQHWMKGLVKYKLERTWNRLSQPNSNELTHCLPAAMEKNHRKSVTKVGVWAEIWTWNLPNTKKKC